LLKQQAKKEIKLKNTGSIPCKWKITGLENVPEEFSFVNTSGDLKPTQETVVEVNFKAIKQQKFDIKLNLEVEDTEGLDVKQEVKVLQIEAEAFDITIDLKFPENNDDNMLDFGAVRVGDFKD
jgi:hydrocephalus-inducing protein